MPREELSLSEFESCRGGAGRNLRVAVGALEPDSSILFAMNSSEIGAGRASVGSSFGVDTPLPVSDRCNGDPDEPFVSDDLATKTDSLELTMIHKDFQTRIGGKISEKKK